MPSPASRPRGERGGGQASSAAGWATRAETTRDRTQSAFGHGHVDVPPPGTPGTARRTPAASRRAQIPRENDSVRIARLLGRAKQRDDRMAVQRIVRLAATPAVDVPDNRIARFWSPLSDSIRSGEGGKSVKIPIRFMPGYRRAPIDRNIAAVPPSPANLHRDDHGRGRTASPPRPWPRTSTTRRPRRSPPISTSRRRGKNRRSHPISPRTQARRSVARTEQAIRCHRSLRGPAIRVPPLSHPQPLTQTHR